VADAPLDLDLAALCATAEIAARAGGAVVTQNFGTARNVRTKAPGDWVSAVDIDSEAAVREVLSLETGLPVFGEEAGGERAALGWLVDPLDGTANFLHGFDAVGVSVALVRDGVPVVGVVFAPLLDRTWTATLGGGATCDGRPIRVSERAPEQAICATGFPFRRPDVRPAYLTMLGASMDRFEDLRRVGAASLDLCWVAEGVFDGFFEIGLGPWDVAAGALVIREAGGVVTDWAGDDGAWLSSGDILAAPPRVHATLRELAGAVPKIG
jgi:myo-inositol-1(or 4)-monophosphatase